MEPIFDKSKNKIVRLIILTGWFLSLFMMLGIIGTTLYIMAHGNDAPETLKQWGGVALGFLFGGFASIIKDYVDD